MEDMRGLLRHRLSRSLKTMPEIDRLAAAWTVTCGPAMASRGEVVEFKDGIVQIQVTDRAWMRQMESMCGVLEKELGKIAGVAISKIHFEVKDLCERDPKGQSRGKV